MAYCQAMRSLSVPQARLRFACLPGELGCCLIPVTAGRRAQKPGHGLDFFWRWGRRQRQLVGASPASGIAARQQVPGLRIAALGGVLPFLACLRSKPPSRTSARVEPIAADVSSGIFGKRPAHHRTAKDLLLAESGDLRLVTTSLGTAAGSAWRYRVCTLPRDPRAGGGFPRLTRIVRHDCMRTPGSVAGHRQYVLGTSRRRAKHVGGDPGRRLVREPGDPATQGAPGRVLVPPPDGRAADGPCQRAVLGH